MIASASLSYASLAACPFLAIEFQGMECFEANRAFGALRRERLSLSLVTIVWEEYLNILWRLRDGFE